MFYRQEAGGGHGVGWSVLEGPRGYCLVIEVDLQTREKEDCNSFLVFGHAVSHVGSYHMWDPKPGIELAPSTLKMQS